MFFKVSKPVTGGMVYKVEADSKETVQALFSLYENPEEFCPFIEIISDAIAESGELIIEEWKDSDNTEQW